MGKDDDSKRRDDGGKHSDKEEQRRETDGHRPINPDTVREPPPGKHGR